jgi:hypothetical protein
VPKAEVTIGARTMRETAKRRASASTGHPSGIGIQPDQPMAANRHSPDRQGHAPHCPPPPGVGPSAGQSLADKPTRPATMALDDQSPAASRGTVIRSAPWDEKAA